MIKHSTEWYETLGDAMDEVREEREVHEAMTHELTEADLDDWYDSLIRAYEDYENHKKDRS